MTLEQRIRAIRLIEMMEENPQTARELGISVNQRISGSEAEEKEGRGRGDVEER